MLGSLGDALVVCCEFNQDANVTFPSLFTDIILSVLVRARSTIGRSSSIILLMLLLRIFGTSAVLRSRSRMPAPILSLGSPEMIHIRKMKSDTIW